MMSHVLKLLLLSLLAVLMFVNNNTTTKDNNDDIDNDGDLPFRILFVKAWTATTRTNYVSLLFWKNGMNHNNNNNRRKHKSFMLYESSRMNSNGIPLSRRRRHNIVQQEKQPTFYNNNNTRNNSKSSLNGWNDDDYWNNGNNSNRYYYTKSEQYDNLVKQIQQSNDITSLLLCLLNNSNINNTIIIDNDTSFEYMNHMNHLHDMVSKVSYYHPSIALIILHHISSSTSTFLTTRTKWNNNNDKQLDHNKVLSEHNMMISIIINSCLSMEETIITNKDDNNNNDIGTNIDFIHLNHFDITECIVSLSIICQYYEKYYNNQNKMMIHSSTVDAYNDTYDMKMLESISSMITIIRRVCMKLWIMIEDMNNVCSDNNNNKSNNDGTLLINDDSNQIVIGQTVRQLSIKRLSQCILVYHYMISLHKNDETIINDQLQIATSTSQLYDNNTKRNFNVTKSISSSNNKRGCLYDNICYRIIQSDAIRDLTGKDILNILRGMIMYAKQHQHHDILIFNSIQYNLIHTIIKRCGKQKIRESTTIPTLLSIIDNFRQLYSILLLANTQQEQEEIIINNYHTESNMTHVHNNVMKDIPKLIYTISNCILNRIISTKTIDDEQILILITLSDMRILLDSINEVIGINNLSNDDKLLKQIYQIFGDRLVVLNNKETNNNNNNNNNNISLQIHDMARIFIALQQYDDDWNQNDSMKNYSYKAYSNLGTMLHELVENYNPKIPTNNDYNNFIRPKDINTILRSILLVCRTFDNNNQNIISNNNIMKPYCVATTILILKNPSFISMCRMNELVNILWFVSNIKSNSIWEVVDEFDINIETTTTRQAILLALGKQNLLLSSNSYELSYTPKLVSRILSSFTKAMYSTSNDEIDSSNSDLQYVLMDLFETFGEHLLTSQITPTETSSLLYSYSISSYINDIGMFDHLTNIIKNHININQCNCNAQIVIRSLWSCAKMMNIEYEEHNFVEHYYPPYIDNTKIFIAYLIENIHILTEHDIIQLLWSIQKIQSISMNVPQIINSKDNLSNSNHHNTMHVLLSRIQQLSSQFTTKDVICLLYYIHQLKTIDPTDDISIQYYKTAFILTRRFACTYDAFYEVCTNDGFTSYDASTIISILGKMNIRDEVIFNNLSLFIMNKLETVQASMIAAVLSAHRAVHLNPPQQLLDQWAIVKLGLRPVPTEHRDYHPIADEYDTMESYNYNMYGSGDDNFYAHDIDDEEYV